MASTPPVSQILEKMKKTRILCVGDVMLDQFVYGAVDRISPEAPVPVLLATSARESAGGVGNVAANLAGIGCAVRLVSVAGADAGRALLDAALAALPDLEARLVTDPARPTTIKTRYCTGAQQVLRVDREDVREISPATEDAVLAALRDSMPGCHALVLSDYGKGVLTQKVLRAAIDAAVAAGIPVLVDPKGRDYTRYRGATVVTPNRKELAEATGGMATATDADVEAAARALQKNAGITSVIATRSADGMTVLDGAAAPLHLRTEAREVYDVSGAGDTVVAVVAAALAGGATLADAARMANTAAGIVVGKVGTAAVTRDELARASAQGVSVTVQGRTLAPVLGWQDARAEMDRWKAMGLTVGFTNGCFDIVHQGHVMMLDRCRAKCDRLVLGLNTDASITRLKGSGRPVNKQDARALVVAALGSVDAVVLFGDTEAEGDTPLELMKALKPDVIFKGRDYTEDRVVGADFVKSYGGCVELIELEDGFSTTATIKKLGSAA